MSNGLGDDMDATVDAKTSLQKERAAGFWVRFAAFCLDGAIVFGAVALICAVAGRFGTYVPFELTFFLLLVCYSAFFTALMGRTPGKALCGLRVVSGDGAGPGFLRVLVRECVGKPVSAIVLFLGFVWIAVSKEKRGWHDLVSRTRVVHTQQHAIATLFGVIAGLGIGVVIFGAHAYSFVSVWLVAREMAVPGSVKSPYSDRDPSSLITPSSLTGGDYEAFAGWLDENGRNPADYAVDTAAKYQLTIFGEGLHGLKEFLEFFNQIIPALHANAEVTCIGLEACPSFNNRDLDRLVMASNFDRELALRIARSQLWKDCAYKEYWDVLETVWRLNQTIPEGGRKMRVVGLDVDADLTSWALLGLGDDGVKNAPPWEKLRAFRLIDDVAYLAKRDELMARTVEKEIIEKGERGVILIGANHSHIHYGWPMYVIEGRARGEKRRMGYMLHNRHGDRVYQVLLYHGNEDACPEVLSRVMDMRGNAPVAFDVAGAPFEMLKAGFPSQPEVCLADVVPGIIYLGKSSEFEPCARVPGFITTQMFLRYKPFYELKAGRSLETVGDANAFVR